MDKKTYSTNKTSNPTRSKRRKRPDLIHLPKELFNNITNTLDETEMLSQVVDTLSRHFDKTVVAINLVDQANQFFILSAFSAKLEKGDDLPSYLPINCGVIGKAAAQRSVVLINDTQQCEYYVEKFPATRSELACPLIYQHNLFGVLNLESEQPGTFTKEDVEMVEIIAGILAMAIENSRANRQIQELSATKDALLERQSHDYQHIFENAVHGMARSTPEGRFLIVNAAFARILGYDSPEEMLKVKIGQDLYVEPGLREKLLEQLEDQGAISDYETQLKRCDGQIIDVNLHGHAVRDSRGKTLYYDGVIEDISEQKRQRQAARWKDRMATMGELAAVIAHEIRNPLGAVLNSAEELQARIELTGTNQRLLEIILEEVERLEHIVRDFLEFARPSAPKFTSADLHQILLKTLEIVAHSHQLKPDVIIEQDFTSGLPLLSLDADRMLQVFLNIILNAVQSIRRAGQVQIITRLKVATPPDITENQVLIKVTDTGAGISSTNLNRIFEPFFTTKPSGTGLGLPIAKQIVEMHSGKINIDSEEGQGTTVTIILPIKFAPIN